MATVVLGSQWGDEGKGKIVDILAPEYSLCARAQGGHNAGHSIVANGVSYDFHLLPSGLMNPRCINLIGSGVVVHVPTFFAELATLEKKGLTNVHDRILISDRCTIDFDLHVAVDGLEEIELGANSIGTTKRGIGPSYSTRASRNAITISEMFREELFERKLRTLAQGYQKRFGDLLKYDVEEEINRFKDYRTSLAPYVTDAVALMEDAQNKDTKILIEGGQALMLDITFGTYPYVTSSSTGIGGVLTGLAINPRKLAQSVGVVKAYTTRVGGGPFPTEDTAEIGTKLQEQGREWGVSTGRRRRCGWLDLVVVKYSHAVNHYDTLNLTKLDILDNFPTIKVAVAYKDPETKQPLPSFPADLDLLGKVDVEYVELPGWNKPTTGAKTFFDLPKEAREYVLFIEKFLAVNGKGPKVRWIGTGPGREEMIDRGA